MSATTIAIHQTQSFPVLRLLATVLARIEWFRVRNHLCIVEKELRQKNVEHLSLELRQERSKNIARLHAYWIQGQFPINTDFLDRRIPYFRDASDTPCAMAYLLEQSGHQDVVNAVARHNNHVYINDIHDGPVIDWIRASGFTQAEAARVQPSYGYGPPWKGALIRDPMISDAVIVSSGSQHPLLLSLLLWIIGSIGFIFLEWLSYTILSSLALGNNKRRLAVWLYFTINNLFIILVLGFVISELL